MRCGFLFGFVGCSAWLVVWMGVSGGWGLVVDRGVQRVKVPTNLLKSDQPEAQRVDLKSMVGQIWVSL